MDNSRLLLAAEVNDFGQKLRNSARSRFEETLPHRYGSEENKPALAEWNAQNPLNKFFAIAYRELMKTTEVMDQVDAENAKAEQEKIDATRATVDDIRKITADGKATPSE